MRFFTTSNIITMSIIMYLCVVMPNGASGRVYKNPARLSRYFTDTSKTMPTKPASIQKHANASGHNTSSIAGPRAVMVRRNKNKDGRAQRDSLLRKNTTSARKALVRSRAATPTKRRRQNEQPTPEPTGDASASTTVYVNGANAFALLLPNSSGEEVSDAEEDGIAYCTDGKGCGNPFPNGFITGASYLAALDGSYVQITGCMDASKFPFVDGDDGGQFDVRFPNGAQCTFGGYGASFIELVEPSANRFCLRCCKNADDQQNCNSHQDRAGCPVAVPGTYEFGEVGCS